MRSTPDFIRPKTHPHFPAGHHGQNFYRPAPLASKAQPATEPRRPEPFGEGALEPQGWMRFHQGALSQDQALQNLEQAVSVLQATELCLAQIEKTLDLMRTKLDAAWTLRSFRPPHATLEAQLFQKLSRIQDWIEHSRFHGRGLINGESGVSGRGEGIAFLRGGRRTKGSPREGYPVEIFQFPEQATLTGCVPVMETWLQQEDEIFVAEGERHVRFSPKNSRSIADFLRNFQRSLLDAGLGFRVFLDSQKRLVLRHPQYGTLPRFKGRSNQTPLISRKPGQLVWSRQGRDISGSIAGEQAFGLGRILVGHQENEHTAELALLWQEQFTTKKARCFVEQNGLFFQSHGDEDLLEALVLPNFAQNLLGGWLDTFSGFADLKEIRLGCWQDVWDALRLTQGVKQEVRDKREEINVTISCFQEKALDLLQDVDGVFETPLALEETSRLISEKHVPFRSPGPLP